MERSEGMSVNQVGIRGAFMNISDNGKLIKRIEAQIAVANEINSDFISLTCGEGKKILAILNEQEVVNPKKIKGFNPPLYVQFKYVCNYCNSDLIIDQHIVLDVAGL